MIAEPGMRLAALAALLETVGLSLDLSGRLPNLAVVDALAIGLQGRYPRQCAGSDLFAGSDQIVRIRIRPKNVIKQILNKKWNKEEKIDLKFLFVFC